MNKVKQDIYGKPAEPTLILETIFKHVFDGISLYGGFIKLDSYSPFFHERPDDAKIRGICQLLYVALQNNCILNAFFHELSSMKKPDIKITGKSEKLIKNSVLNTILPTPKKPNEENKPNEKNKPNEENKSDEEKPKEIARSQFFQNRKKIFENPHDMNTYVNQILKALDTSGRKGEVLPLTVMKYIAPTANFLFTEASCTGFGRLLRDKKEVVDKYNILWNKYNEIKDAYESDIDKLIFETGMNAVFGFTFFESIRRFIEKVHSMPISENKSLRDLEGQQFADIISQAANLPMFFNKELFVKFACYAFVSSQNTDYSYFEDSPKTAVTVVSPSRPKQQQAIYALDLMRKFFQILSYVTLPMLYSLWETVVYEIRRKAPKLLTIDVYKNYLSDNYNSIVYDYVPIPDETISKWGDPAFTAKKYISNNTLLEYIKENPVCYEETTSKWTVRIKNISGIW